MLTFENVDAALLVQKNKRKWPKLNQTAPLKEGTDLVLPLPGNAHEHTRSRVYTRIHANEQRVRTRVRACVMHACTEEEEEEEGGGGGVWGCMQAVVL